MFKRLQYFALINGALILTLIANSGVNANSMWTMYEPEIPKCLKK